jgi:hypothetical protein
MPSSLAEVVKSNRSGENDESKLKQKFTQTSKLNDAVYGGRFKMADLVAKGEFPYAHLKGDDTMKETEMPPLSAFYDDINDEECTPERYEVFKRMWVILAGIIPHAVRESPEMFIPNYANLDEHEKHCCINEESKMSFKHYHDLYLFLDCYLLADAWGQFRQQSMKNWGLEAQNFVSMPSLSWTAMLKGTQARLEQLTSKEMYLNWEDGSVGGLVAVIKQLETANHPDCSGFDPEKPLKFLEYIDINNLYVSSLIEALIGTLIEALFFIKLQNLFF